MNSEVLAASSTVNDLGVPTSNSASLKRNGTFQRRAHRSGSPRLMPLPDPPNDDGDYAEAGCYSTCRRPPQ
jgi:hypothetical protein